jgi:hypothetical protein
VGINQLQLENVKQIKQYDRTAATSIDIAVGIMGNPEMT